MSSIAGKLNRKLDNTMQNLLKMHTKHHITPIALKGYRRKDKYNLPFILTSYHM